MMKNLTKIVAVISLFATATCMAQDKTIFFVFKHLEDSARSAGKHYELHINLYKNNSTTHTASSPWLAPGASDQDHVTNSVLAPDPTGDYTILYQCREINGSASVGKPINYTVTSAHKVLTLAATCVHDGWGVDVDIKPIS